MMMKFQITLELKTLKGFETIGSFEIGTEPNFAKQLFEVLDGDETISENAVISMGLISAEDGVQLPLKWKHCTWEQLAMNTKLIVKELFKRYNLEPVHS